MIKEFVDMPRLEKAVGKSFAFLSPNTWTTVSLFVAIGAFWAIVEKQILLGLALFAVSGALDVIDGKVARYSNRSSKLGAFWDGTADRFVDALMILCFFYLEFPSTAIRLGIVLSILLFITVLPPFIVAYANHRGAVPDPTEKVIWRFAFRIEYMVIYLLVIAVNPFSPTISYYLLWAGFVLMAATVIQSIILVFVKAKLYL